MLNLLPMKWLLLGLGIFVWPGKVVYMEKLYTYGELYQAVKELIKKEDRWTDILEYDSVDRDIEHENIVSDEFEVRFEVRKGGSEGIYLDLFACEYDGHKETNRRLACLKTLSDSKAALRKMSMLGAEFYISANEWIRENHRLLWRQGYRIDFLDPKTGEVLDGSHLLPSPDFDRAFARFASYVSRGKLCRLVDCETLEVLKEARDDA